MEVLTTNIRLSRWGALVFASVSMLLLDATPVSAEMEEIVVTARKREESLQNSPVTITALSSDQIEDHKLDKIAEIATRIPSFTVVTGGSGQGGSIAIRGVGSSSISASFDSAVLLNIDGMPISSMRIVQNSFMDMEQIEVLKGPQTLYFGKSASAGVMSLKSKGPGDQFEAGISISHEFEEKSEVYEGYVSGPLSDTLGARLAVRAMDTDEMIEDTAAGGNFLGEESLDARLTLAWAPNDKFDASLKFAISEYDSDDAIQFVDITCDGNSTSTRLGGTPVVTAPNDCDPYGDVVQRGRLHPNIAANPYGDGFNDDTWGNSDVSLTVLAMEYQLSDNLTLNSVSGLFDIESDDNGIYAYDASGIGPFRTNYKTESRSQELRLSSDFEGRFNFMLGAYYQSRDQLFRARAGVFNWGVTMPDPITGKTTDYDKIHETDTSAKSVFGSVDLQLTDQLSVTAGLRWTDEEKEGSIFVPYMHAAHNMFLPPALQFVPSGTRIEGLEFEDDDLSPEVTVLYELTDNLNLFGAYKRGFKSGGIDNSAVPSIAGLSGAGLAGLIYDSETAEGFEAGFKATLVDSSIRLNATIYSYVYEDLQVQNFDVGVFSFVTSNAGEVTSEGLEVDLVWLTPIDGLMLTGALAWTETEFTEEFIVGTDDLKGREVARAPELSGNVGLEYVTPLGESLELSMSGLVAFSSEYYTDESSLNDFEQSGYGTVDLAIAIRPVEGNWSFRVSANNITDKVYTVSTSGRPGRIAPAQDLVLNQVRGRQVFATLGVHF